MATERMERWRELVAAFQAFIDAMPNDDLPRTFHGIIGIEDKDTMEPLRHWPVRITRSTDNPADEGQPR